MGSSKSAVSQHWCEKKKFKSELNCEKAKKKKKNAKKDKSPVTLG